MSAQPCSETTARGTPCRLPALAGTERCSIHSRGTNVGRVGAPTKLTPELADQFVAMLRAGNYIGVAAHAARISRATFGAWMRRGLSRRAPDRPYREFRARVEQARAEGEVRNVAQIARAAVDNWQAAAWLLERQYPERWGRPSAPQRREAPPEEPVIAEESFDAFAEVDELAERRRKRQV